MTNIELLKEIWEKIYNPDLKVINTIDDYFDKDYQQCINGVKLNRTEYIQHIIEQRHNININEINYKHVLEKDNELFAIYYPQGIDSKSLPVEAEVIAYFLFKNGKLYRIHGQVRLIKGNLADVDMDKQNNS